MSANNTTTSSAGSNTKQQHQQSQQLERQLLVGLQQLYVSTGELTDGSLQNLQPGKPDPSSHTKARYDAVVVPPCEASYGGENSKLSNKTPDKNGAMRNKEGSEKNGADDNGKMSMDPVKSAEKTCGLVRDIVEKLAAIADDDQFSEQYGFRMDQYLQERDSLARDLPRLVKRAKDLEKKRQSWFWSLQPDLMRLHDDQTLIKLTKKMSGLKKKMRMVGSKGKTIAGIMEELVNLDHELQAELDKWTITEEENKGDAEFLHLVEVYGTSIKDLVNGTKALVHDEGIVYKGAKLAWGESNPGRQLEAIALGCIGRNADNAAAAPPASAVVLNVTFPGSDGEALVKAGRKEALRLVALARDLSNLKNISKFRLNVARQTMKKNTANMIDFVAYAREQVECCVADQ